MTLIELARLHHPVTALGYGVRAGIWVQGCTLACSGCLARDTWPRRPGNAVPVSRILDWLAVLPAPLDGVTISGGEPLQQPAALGALLDAIGAWRADRELDVLLYTGYGWGRAARHRAVRAHCDAVIAGRYVERRNTGDTPLRGSANQRVVPLTDLGHRRYGPDAATMRPGGALDASVQPSAQPSAQPSLQAGVVAGRLWLIGIPRPGDLDRIRDRLNARGVRAEDASWTS
jgi:anaerobic ribonucleoside-triphosphate reductase activating protein